MSLQDQCCAIYPYFEVQAGQLEAFRALCQRFVERTATEAGCLYYGFSFAGHQVHCREGYVDAAALLTHLENVGDLLQEAFQIAQIIRLEVHGPASELDRLREPLAGINPQFFVLDYGFRKTSC